MDSQNTPNAVSLNEFQARRLRVTCQYIDKLLGEVEEILNIAASKAAFPRYSGDVAPTQRRTIEDYISRIRAQLVRVLDGQGILREKPSIPASRAIHVALGTIDIAVEELKPQYMRGYGDLPEDAATELNGIVGELRGLVSRLDRYLAEGVEQDLKLRLMRLEQKNNDLELLSKIEEIVAHRGLVEFRTTIGSILDRAEDKTFEIAVFGRVSSGKSSLLNAILETDALPVGVTPITAVPTRIAYGEKPSMRVSFAEAPAKTMEVARLAEFATEQQNPGNAKRVTRISVALPASRLRDGVTFVDTPGLGSLATSGAAETLAYLPKCDLGVVLIDAGSTLTTEDLQTILTLQEATIPANVLLSKADLLAPGDREKIIEYVKQHIASDCNLELHVRPISVFPSHKELLSRWFEEQIVPLYDHSQELRASSLRRKIGALRESVISALRVQVQRNGTSTCTTQDEIRAAEARLRQATGLIEDTGAAWERELERNGFDAFDGFLAASSSLMGEWGRNLGAEVSTENIIRNSVLNAIQQRVKKLHGSLEALAVQLRDDLKKSAGGLGIADIPGEDEFQSLVRGTPIFDPGSLSASVVRPRFSGLLGRRFAEKRLATRLHKELGEALNKTLGTYSDVLREWTRLVTNQLLRRFETYAEGYRAQAERSLGGKDLAPDEANGLREDIRLLEFPESNEVEPNSQTQTASEGVFPFSGETIRRAHRGKSD
ncbi:MAG TPA: dynamin family protein [Candidatus Acidoferrales bacterium]|nr:dynamin family protein [Candidatus Acidoferrales bacterium]